MKRDHQSHVVGITFGSTNFRMKKELIYQVKILNINEMNLKATDDEITFKW